MRHTGSCDGTPVARGMCKCAYNRWYHENRDALAPLPPVRPIARFMARTRSGPEWTCWEWIGGLVDGYGTFYADGVRVRAHRWAYEHFIGPIRDDLQIDHLCRNRACVNPWHLQPVTQRENILRGEGLAAQAARRDECSEGHAYTPENTYLRKRPDGSIRQRVCRTCKRARNLEYKARKRKAVA